MTSMLDLALLARILISAALLLQLASLRHSKRVNPAAFLLYALASYLMASQYYQADGQRLTSRVLFKIVNSTLLLLIALWAR